MSDSAASILSLRCARGAARAASLTCCCISAKSVNGVGVSPHMSKAIGERKSIPREVFLIYQILNYISPSDIIFQASVSGIFKYTLIFFLFFIAVPTSD